MRLRETPVRYLANPFTVLTKPAGGIAVTRQGYSDPAWRSPRARWLLAGSLRAGSLPLAGYLCELGGDGLGARESKADQRDMFPAHDSLGVDDEY
jgi:hypothetical protein